MRASALAGRVPDAYACEDLGWDSKRFQNGLKTLSEAGFVKYDGMAKVVWIVKFVKWNRPDNPNQQKSIIKLAQALPDSLARSLSRMKSSHRSEFPKRLRNR